MQVSNALKCTGFASSMIPFESYSTTAAHVTMVSSAGLRGECVTSAVVVQVGIEPCRYLPLKQALLPGVQTLCLLGHSHYSFTALINPHLKAQNMINYYIELILTEKSPVM